MISNKQIQTATDTKRRERQTWQKLKFSRSFVVLYYAPLVKLQKVKTDRDLTLYNTDSIFSIFVKDAYITLLIYTFYA